jgi:hypothetical protein
MDARYGSAMIRRYRPTDEDELIRVWLASTIPGQDFLPEEFWRFEEPMVREQHPIVRVEVFRDNARAVAFYEHRGFVEESAAPHPETGLEAVIMRLDGTPST